MLNWFFLILVAVSVVTAAFNGTMQEVSNGTMDSAKSAVNLAIGLVGQMGLWLGFMKILQEAGLMKALSRRLSPIMCRLFPDVPSDHPAMGAMILNISANMLGLGNAATPFGLKAMVELNKLNKRPGVATNAMVLFLAINTSGVAVLPLGAVAMRATTGSHDAAGIIIPSILATMCSTLMGVVMVKILEKLKMFSVESIPLSDEEKAAAAAEAGHDGHGEVHGHQEDGRADGTDGVKDEARKASADEKGAGAPQSQNAATRHEAEIKGLSEAEKEVANEGSTDMVRAIISLVVWGVILFAVGRFIVLSTEPALTVVRQLLSGWILPLIMLAIVSVGFSRRVKVYEVFIAGAKDSFQIAITIIPFLIAILVAVGMFRQSGAMNLATSFLGPITNLVGLPPELLPMAIIRPLSGSGALGVLTETMNTYGPDSLIGYMVSIMSGSTETTFYVLAVYYGAVGVKATRHTVACCLSADLAGILASAWLARLFFRFFVG